MSKKLTLDDLRALRNKSRAALEQRTPEGKTVEIIVGMGTCGIAAGAKETFDALLEALAANQLDQVLVKQTGCMGLCHSEPTVEVRAPDMPPVIYGHVDAQVADRIVTQHVMAGTLIENHIFDRPAGDIMARR
ncbi:MAG: (2Fe-2S) ferredoxin domain-containing protein [Candidatus Marinimicrobia bacterium]|nr:(2Fe-2S) ferredoxin domain-containing protein [Candidatus Neomarinimicrobiota bacterium]